MESMSASEIDIFQPPKVICLGEALVDRLGPLGGDPSKDEPVEDCFGGAPANVACGLARLGTRVGFCGCLGKDQIGLSFKNLMFSRGVDLRGLQIDISRPSRIVLVRRDTHGERSFEGFAGDKGAGFADQSHELGFMQDQWSVLTKKARWLLTGTISLASAISAETLIWSVEEAQKNGLKIGIDVNWRPTFWNKHSFPNAGPSKHCLEIIKAFLQRASFLKLSKEEAVWFFSSSDPVQIAESLAKKPDVVITDGAKPIRWIIGGFTGEMQVLKPKNIVDTTGAGDAFNAGLIHQMVLRESSHLSSEMVRDMVGFAAACGALVCNGPGAIEPQPTQEEVEIFLG